VTEQLALQEILGDGAAIDAQHLGFGASGGVVDGARHDLLPGAGFARDQHRHVGVFHAIDQRVDLAHREAGTDQTLITEMAVQRFAGVAQLLARAFELFGAPVQQLAQARVRLGQLFVGAGKLVGTTAIFDDETRVFERDRDLVRERAQRRQLALEMPARAATRLEIQRADGEPGRRQDWHARHRLERQLMYRRERLESIVTARVERDHRFARGDHPFRDRAREFAASGVSRRRAAASRVHAERAVRLRKQYIAALGSQQLHGVSDDLGREPLQIELARQIAVYLENARQALLQRREPAELRHGRGGAGGAALRSQGRAGRRQGAERRERQKLGGGVADGAGYRAAQRLTSRIVPVYLAQVARQPCTNLFQHRQRFLAVAPSEQRLPAALFELRACLERAPQPLSLLRTPRRLDGRIQPLTRRELVAQEAGDSTLREQ
jgi:hypothetical protein